LEKNKTICLLHNSLISGLCRRLLDVKTTKQPKMMTTQMKQTAFKALFTAESMEAYEKEDTKNIFPPAKALIKSACEDDEPEHINTAIPPMPFKKLTREFHLTHDVFLVILWKYSIYANDPSITSPEAFNDKMEELTTYRMGAGLQGLDGDIPDINCEDNKAGKYDDIIIHNAILGVFLHSAETLRTGCESCPSCLEEAEKKRALAEKRAMVQRNVAEALRRRAEEEGGDTPQTPTATPEEVVVEVSTIPIPVVSAIPLAVSPLSAEDEYYLDLEKQLRTGTTDIPLNIEEIDNIPVRVMIERSKYSLGNLHLRVYLSVHNYYHDPDQVDDTCLYSYYTGGNNNGIDPVVKIIDILKIVMDYEQFCFDKIHNGFFSGKEYMANILEKRRKDALFENAFKGKKGRKLALSGGRECPACNENTLGMTGCGHPLCLPCLIKVDEIAYNLNKAKNQEADDDNYTEDYEVPCPMCRQDLIGEWKQRH